MDKSQEKLTGLYKLLIVVLIIWISSMFIISMFHEELSHRAEFGDSFGVINSLFSGLAFAGIIYTILLQRKELGLQREELRETRKELSRSAVAQEKSQESLYKQSLNTLNTLNASRINALSTMIENCNSIISQKNSPTTIKNAKSSRRDYIAQMNNIIQEMKKSNLDTY